VTPGTSNFASNLSAMEMLERGNELETLLSTFEQSRRRLGATVLISGEAGIGKTRLLREFVARITSTARVFAGSCDDLLTPRVLGPFRDMVRDSDGALAALNGQTDSEAFVEAMLEQMDAPARPAVVIVEDVHWADDASLDIIRYLGRRINELPAMLCLTYRPEEVVGSDTLWRVLGSLTGPAVVRIELTGLSEAAVAEQAVTAGLDPDYVVAAVGGNPFYLTEMLAAPDGGVPASVRDAIVTRMHVLPEPARDAVELLAVVPGGAEWSLLASVLDNGTAALAAAERAGLVTASGGRYTFRHELAREAVEDSLPSRRRTQLNRAVFESLAVAGAEVSRLVHHAVRAGDRAAIARYAAVAASEAISAHAHREAASFAQLALDCSDLIDDQRDIARLHGEAAHALRMLNQPRRANYHAEQAIAAWEAVGSPAEDLGKALLAASRIQPMLADARRGRQLAYRAAETLERAGRSPTLALAYSMLGSSEYFEIRPRSAQRWCERAIALAKDLDCPDVAAHAYGYLGLATVILGDETGLQHLERAADFAGAVGHAEHLVRALVNHGAMLMWLGRHAEAGPLVETAAQLAREHNNAWGGAHAGILLCRLELFRGAWDAAEARLRELLAGDGEPVAMLTPPLALLGRLLARRDDPAAKELIDNSWQIAEASGQLFRLAIAGTARIEWAWLNNETAAIREIGADLLAVAARGHIPYFRAEVLRYLKRAGTDVTGFDRCPAPFAAGIAGDWQTAARLWKEAGNPYEAALELLESPDPGTALRGLRLLDELGAVATATKMRRQLRERGVAGVPRGPRSVTKRNPAQLTKRQLEVLALLASGLTGPEIAERLCVSQRTMEHHVSAILRKLKVHSREAAVAAATSRGILSQQAESAIVGSGRPRPGPPQNPLQRSP
jgi:DNA-binding CsgD family transcriptional regulator/tetratricopeptide (TPR) repeat protein